MINVHNTTIKPTFRRNFEPIYLKNSEENFSVYADDKRSRYNKFNLPPAGMLTTKNNLSNPNTAKIRRKPQRISR